MFCEMRPPIRASIHRLTPNSWMMGSLIVCERVTTSIPSNAIISWQDGDRTFYLREKVEEDLLLLQDGSQTGLVHEGLLLPEEDGSELRLVHQGGTSAAVWSIGVDALCKVKAWREGMELESETINFVREREPEIPVPEVIYTWIDHSWNRTFLVLRRVKGRTLDEEWPRLTSDQRLEIANKIAAYCCKLASISASRFETAAGHAVDEPFFNGYPAASHPSWMPRRIGPFSSKRFASYLLTIAPGSCLDVGDVFCFYHGDLGPTNIMVRENNVTGILDWESAAYYPKFWIATKPRLSAGFHLQQDRTDPKAWSKILCQSLKEVGFSPNIDGYNDWKSKRN